MKLQATLLYMICWRHPTKLIPLFTPNANLESRPPKKTGSVSSFRFLTVVVVKLTNSPSSTLTLILCEICTISTECHCASNRFDFSSFKFLGTGKNINIKEKIVNHNNGGFRRNQHQSKVMKIGKISNKIGLTFKNVGEIGIVR